LKTNTLVKLIDLIDPSKILIGVSLPSSNLDAFLSVAKTEGFSSAAKQLSITQSALSQRIKNLEDALGLTLFIRTPIGAILTEHGERLLRYCQTRDMLEEELIQDLNGSTANEISGTLKIAGYSSVLRSVLLPALTPLLNEHPSILCEFICSGMPDLPRLLQRSEVDFIVMDYHLDKANLNVVKLGQEQYVAIEGKHASQRNDIFLDNNSDDRATEKFLKLQGSKTQKFRRSYFDDCYGIIDGVALGLGRAVIPKHLISKNLDIKVLKGSKPYAVDVVLHYYQQPFYSKLHQAVIHCLSNGASRYLDG
jgi:DNA-binding transcriptional LysR family regulator